MKNGVAHVIDCALLPSWVSNSLTEIDSALFFALLPLTDIAVADLAGPGGLTFLATTQHCLEKTPDRNVHVLLD